MAHYHSKHSGIEIQRAIAREHHDPDRDYTGTMWHQYLKDIGIYDELYGEERHQFITIGLPNDYPIKKIKKFIKRPYLWLEDAILSVEKYRKNGEHLHIHILRKGYHSKTKIIRDLSTKFKVSRNYIDVRKSKSSADYTNRNNYIRGIKSDNEKLECVEKDIEWRKTENLENYYML